MAVAALGLDALLIPEWPAPDSVQAFCSTRLGGVSAAPFNSLNLGDHVGDEPQAVAENRTRLLSLAPQASGYWLQQVHGTRVLNLDAPLNDFQADAARTSKAETLCAVMTADCLPVLFCHKNGQEVAAAHAGWRGLAAGVLEATLNALNDSAENYLAWLGPAIGPAHFEVGPDVREAFVSQLTEHQAAFEAQADNKYLADIYRLARQKLVRCGLTEVSGGGLCTYADPERFFSYRREPRTGRMASVIWINS